jgi:hypothetical protein
MRILTRFNLYRCVTLHVCCDKQVVQGQPRHSQMLLPASLPATAHSAAPRRKTTLRYCDRDMNEVRGWCERRLTKALIADLTPEQQAAVLSASAHCIAEPLTGSFDMSSLESGTNVAKTGAYVVVVAQPV